jgi:hypothetical protein
VFSGRRVPLLSGYPDLCLACLDQAEVPFTNANYSNIKITTQQSFEALEDHQHSSRPDMVIALSGSLLAETGDDHDPAEMPIAPTHVIFIESKVGSHRDLIQEVVLFI